MKPKLSILCVTYNQEKYIRSALDSFLMQKTNFDFEVLINDDKSSDSTIDILKEYEQRYPNIIKPIYQQKNLWSQGVNISAKILYPIAQGEYLALCDGDDYWTDEFKLQKQVDFLDSNPDFSICFHPVKIIYEEAPEMEDFFPEPGRRFNKFVFDFDDLIQRNFIPTSSIIYRRIFDNMENLVPDKMAPFDWYTHLMHAKHGKIGFVDEVMAVYRRQPDGVWYVNLSDLKAGKLDELYVNNWYEMANFYKNVVNNIVDNKEEYKVKELKRRIKQLYDALYSYSKADEINTLKEWFPDTMQELECERVK